MLVHDDVRGYLRLKSGRSVTAHHASQLGNVVAHDVILFLVMHLKPTWLAEVSIGSA
jgi:hypothetical protein